VKSFKYKYRTWKKQPDRQIGRRPSVLLLKVILNPVWKKSHALEIDFTSGAKELGKELGNSVNQHIDFLLLQGMKRENKNRSASSRPRYDFTRWL